MEYLDKIKYDYRVVRGIQENGYRFKGMASPAHLYYAYHDVSLAPDVGFASRLVVGPASLITEDFGDARQSEAYNDDFATVLAVKKNASGTSGPFTPERGQVKAFVDKIAWATRTIIAKRRQKGDRYGH